MSYTITQANYFANDKVMQGIVETIITVSDVLGGTGMPDNKAALPFITVTGNTYKYNLESTLPLANFYSVNEDWAENTGTTTPITASLSILGSEAYVDEFERTCRADVEDLEAFALDQAAKALSRKYEWCFVYGDVSADAKSFNGIHYNITNNMSGQQVHAGSSTTGAAGSVVGLRSLCDKVLPSPDVLLMNRTQRNYLSSRTEALTSPVVYQITDFGKAIGYFNGIPINISDWITQTETISGSAFALETTGACSSIFAMRLGEKAVVGLENGGIQKVDLGQLPTKDAKGHRIKWYCGLACISSIALARYDGLTASAWGA